jgi:hypothetical protein
MECQAAGWTHRSSGDEHGCWIKRLWRCVQQGDVPRAQSLDPQGDQLNHKACAARCCHNVTYLPDSAHDAVLVNIT